MILFKDAEDLWFWYMNCLKLKEAKQCSCSFTRPCEPMDITIIVKHLRELGLLNESHMITLDTFGKQGFKPDPNIHGNSQTSGYSRDERQAFIIWKDAMRVLTLVFMTKGFI